MKLIHIADTYLGINDVQPARPKERDETKLDNSRYLNIQMLH